MTWLSLDPSSTRTGYAAWTDSDALVEAGALVPDRTRDGVFARVDAMVRDLHGLFLDPKLGGVSMVVMEVPSGRVGRGARAGATGHLALYGVAVGAVRQACRAHGLHVVAVDEREWTRGRTAAARQAMAAMAVPGYDPAQDRGRDVSDAVGVGLWWIGERARRELVSGGRQ